MTPYAASVQPFAQLSTNQRSSTDPNQERKSLAGRKPLRRMVEMRMKKPTVKKVCSGFRGSFHLLSTPALSTAFVPPDLHALPQYTATSPFYLRSPYAPSVPHAPQVRGHTLSQRCIVFSFAVYPISSPQRPCHVHRNMLSQ
eukprot:2629934-Rhodomonas_salina.1